MSAREVLELLASGDTARAPIDSISAWWSVHRRASTGFTEAIDRAIASGFACDRVGYAFASGYREALVALLPTSGPDDVTVLSATEAGGVKPSAIHTTLDERDGKLVLRGEKKWATSLFALPGTAAEPACASYLLVAARRGTDELGRAKLVMVRVPTSRAGISMRAMPSPSFVPEIEHAEVKLVDVEVEPSEVLPGDGWDAYVKPFRTVEDLFVHAALVSYAIAAARRARRPRALVEEGLALIVLLRGLAAEDPRAPATHLALAGALRASAGFIERFEAAWPADDGEERARWQRDRALFSVASGARAQRAEAAWRDLGAD